MTRITLVCAALAIAIFSAAPRARADELQEFEEAREAYEAQNYPVARRRFEALVGGDTILLQSRPLVLESRKYLGATYLFLGEQDRATNQFRLLLTEDPSYEIDPVGFPNEVLALFSQVRDELRRETAEREARESAERERLARQIELQREAERAELERLRALGEVEWVERENSRILATVPFGVGQFQNGDSTAGWIFAVSEGLLGATSATTFVLWSSLLDENPSADQIDDAQRLEQGFRVVNWISTGLFAAVVIGGIIDAHARYEPVIRRQRQQTLEHEP